MKFSIQSRLLAQRLAAVSKIVSSKNGLSIFDNILFVVSEGENGYELEITGSDQENTVSSKMQIIDADATGSFAVNVKYLLEVVKNMANQVISFEIKQTNENAYEVCIEYLNGKYNFAALDGAEFPRKTFSDTNAVAQIEMPASEIANGIEHTLFAVAVNEEIRVIMTGICWDIMPNQAVFVASDTHKLSRYIDNRIAAGVEASFIMPAKPASILLDILRKTEDSQSVAVIIDEQAAQFTTPDFTVSCQFLKGKYPNYNAAIPQNNPFTLTVDRQCLLNAVKRVSVFSTTGGLVKFNVSNDNVRLEAQDIDYNTSAVETVACDYQGEPLTIAFNAARIIELLNNFDTDNVIIKLSDPQRAAVFVPDEQKEGEDYLVLLMPMFM
ncbi:MAG: DNA polymerase III subunit beta [Muribaculaceae bacterium]|nr:DNA polymerase III subunit beta [Muribaculaceae bacterium]